MLRFQLATIISPECDPMMGKIAMVVIYSI